MARNIDYTKPLTQETVDYLKATRPLQEIERLIDQVGLKKGVVFEISGSTPLGVVVENGDDSLPLEPSVPVVEDSQLENGSDTPPEDLI